MNPRFLSAIPVIAILISRVGCPLLMQGCISAAPIDHFLTSHADAAGPAMAETHDMHGGGHEQVAEAVRATPGPAGHAECVDCCCAGQLLAFSALQDRVASRVPNDESVVPLIVVASSEALAVAAPESPALDTFSPPPET